MTKEEKDKMKVETEKLQIEIKALNAGIVKLEEETKHEAAEARMAEAKALEAEVEAHAAWRKQQKELCTDEENHLYRFSRDVNSNTVNACMSRVTLWHREDPKCDIEIVFSSPGGSIIDGFELFDFLQEMRSTGHKVTTGSLGMAASMAGILLQAGDVRWIGHQAWMMIHRAAFGAIGKTFEIEDEVRLVKRIEQRIVDIFTSRSKLTTQKIKRNWDRKDWWIDADECLELGLVDEIKGMMPEHLVSSKKPKGPRGKKKS